jgi:hypothetical protein
MPKRNSEDMTRTLEPTYCVTCGHFHNGPCEYEAGDDCGSFLCCRPRDASDAPCCEGTPGCTSTHIFDNDECEV